MRIIITILFAVMVSTAAHAQSGGGNCGIGGGNGGGNGTGNESGGGGCGNNKAVEATAVEAMAVETTGGAMAVATTVASGGGTGGSGGGTGGSSNGSGSAGANSETESYDDRERMSRRPLLKCCNKNGNVKYDQTFCPRSYRADRCK